MSDKTRDKSTHPINRRDFLEKSAAAAAAITIAPNVLWGNSPRNDSNDINVAVLGAGAQGQVLVNACLKIPNLRIQLFARKLGAHSESPEFLRNLRNLTSRFILNFSRLIG